MRKPIYIRKSIPLFYNKSENEFRHDVYERYDDMVVRQTALHMADEIWGEYPFQKISDWVFENIPDGKYEHIADLGCGVGRLAAELAKKFSNGKIWGIDFSYQMLRRANEFWVEGKTIELDYTFRGIPFQKINGEKTPNLEFGLANADDLPFSDDSQNILTHTFLFDRLNQPEKALHEMWRVLHPDGIILMVTPLNFQSRNQWERFYPPEKLFDFLENENWEIINSENVEVGEPMDVHGNYITWKCLCISMRKA